MHESVPTGTSAEDAKPSRLGLRRLVWGSRARRLYVVLIMCYSLVLIPYVLIYARTPENLTQLAGVSTCAFTLLAGLRWRSGIQQVWARLRWSPSKKLLLAGGLGAAYVETAYEIWQHVFGAAGVAANPNLLLDLAITLPWYLIMISFLAIALKHARPTMFQLLLFGGVYEFMADGLLGSFLAGKPAFDFLGLPFVIPIFTLVYAPIVALPALAVWPSYQERWATAAPAGSRLWFFLPCPAILIYGIPLALLLTVH